MDILHPFCGAFPDSWAKLVGPFGRRVRHDRPSPQVGVVLSASGKPESAIALPCWRMGWCWGLISPEDEWAVGSNWFLHATGYVVRNWDMRLQYLHRLVAWCHHTGKREPDRHLYLSGRMQVDHGDRNRANNHRANLELVDSALNNLNRGTLVLDGRTSTGITWDDERGKWMAKTSYLGQDVWVGRFMGRSQAEHAIERKREQLERRHRRRIRGEVALATEVPF